MTNEHSTMVFIFTLGSSSIIWHSKKQAIIAMRSLKAKYIGLSTTSKEAPWLAKLTQDFDLLILQCIPIYCNNEGSICIVVNPNINSKIKSISIHHHFIQEKIESGDIILKYVFSLE